MQGMSEYGRGEQPLSMGVAKKIAGVQRSLSHGVKFLLLCVLALFMSLLALFVSSMTDDRSGRAAEVRKELSAVAGGPQVFLGPTLLLPYKEASADAKLPPREGVPAAVGVGSEVPLSDLKLPEEPEKKKD